MNHDRTCRRQVFDAVMASRSIAHFEYQFIPWTVETPLQCLRRLCTSEGVRNRLVHLSLTLGPYLLLTDDQRKDENGVEPLVLLQLKSLKRLDLCTPLDVPAKLKKYKARLKRMYLIVRDQFAHFRATDGVVVESDDLRLW